jgi:formate-dependent nitrite reductase membrane component NrfD
MKYWFKRRRYGWGWVPATWQGWLVIGLYVMLLLVAPSFVDNDSSGAKHTVLFFAFMLLATALLIRIVLLTAPKPKWRWGRRPDDNPDEDF